MTKASINIDPTNRLAPVQPRIFGSFVEHLGRCVYTGIYEPGHPTANAQGFRTDTLAAVRDLGVTTVRYPGGNFVSGYRWEDGIGPVANRPRRLDLAWHSTEPNTFGIDEFMAWAAQAGVEPMIAINLGTRGVQEALDLLEYCNIAGGTTLSDARRANGAAEPHRVKLWCLGNEMDGPWQIGGKTAHEYGRLASQTAKAMRMIDPNLQLVACGSSGSNMPTFGAWEAAVLDEAYDDVDFISAHAYYCEQDGDLASFLASSCDMDYFIDSVVATCDHIRAAKKASKRIMISFDEWNVWYQSRAISRPPTGDSWPVGPVLLEDQYNVADAVVVGSLLISLLKHADRVHAACLAQLVNVIAPIMTEPGGRCWRQTSFHPFAATAKYARGDVLDTPIHCETHNTSRFGEVPDIDAVTIWNGELKEAVVFVVNRSTDQAVDLRIGVSAKNVQVIAAAQLTSPDYTWQASASDDSTNILQNVPIRADEHTINATLAPVSWSMLRLAANW